MKNYGLKMVGGVPHVRKTKKRTWLRFHRLKREQGDKHSSWLVKTPCGIENGTIRWHAHDKRFVLIGAVNFDSQCCREVADFLKEKDVAEWMKESDRERKKLAKQKPQ